ncbi:hypothetical protein B5P46_01295 [Rhizobium leguminosarum]|uniref:Uncharacterized protein n=1 Tax=Rhizobium leguminosarum TaxID=384 RepID=A0A4Q1UF21_RHILE|nr:hypothetical protein B5P46_01295 [Rhizobium leguminosarum]
MWMFTETLYKFFRTEYFFRLVMMSIGRWNSVIELSWRAIMVFISRFTLLILLIGRFGSTAQAGGSRAALLPYTRIHRVLAPAYLSIRWLS